MEGQNKSITFDGREIRLTTGLYAPQANGSVMIECRDTSLLVTATKTVKKEETYSIKSHKLDLNAKVYHVTL